MFTIEESSEQHLNPVYRLHNLQDPQSTIHNPQFTIQIPEVRIIQNNSESTIFSPQYEQHLVLKSRTLNPESTSYNPK